MGAVYLFFQLISRKTNLLRVDHHHMIAAIEVGSEVGLILPNQDARYPRGYAAQNLARRIYHKPLGTLRQRCRLAALWHIFPPSLYQHPPASDQPNPPSI